MEPFAGAGAPGRPMPPRLPYISNVTGTWITPGQATDPEYWARHLRAAGTVRRWYLRAAAAAESGPSGDRPRPQPGHLRPAAPGPQGRSSRGLLAGPRQGSQARRRGRPRCAGPALAGRCRSRLDRLLRRRAPPAHPPAHLPLRAQELLDRSGGGARCPFQQGGAPSRRAREPHGASRWKDRAAQPSRGGGRRRLARPPRRGRGSASTTTSSTWVAAPSWPSSSAAFSGRPRRSTSLSTSCSRPPPWRRWRSSSPGSSRKTAGLPSDRSPPAWCRFRRGMARARCSLSTRWAATSTPSAPWPRPWGSTSPFYGLRSRGLEDGEKPFASVEEMAEHYLELVRDCSAASAPIGSAAPPWAAWWPSR